MKEFYPSASSPLATARRGLFCHIPLKNSLPHEIIKSLKDERERIKAALEQFPEVERAQQNVLEDRQYFGKWDAYLDKAEFGPRWLSQPEIADIVKDALHYRDGKIFDLHAFCIMSNYVHAVFEPISKLEWHSDLYESESGYQPDLPTIMQSLKCHTARQANIVLDRKGAIWQDESYDHVIPDNEEYIRIINYVLENPVKAGLVSKWDEWRWTYCKPDIIL